MTPSGRVTFGFEPLARLLSEPNAAEIIQDYDDEMSPIRDVAPADPDWPEMLRREAAGTFCAWAARVDGTLAGAILFHLLTHLHHRGTFFAMDAGHFLSPAFRDNGRLGFRMWRTAEPALRARGAKIIMGHDGIARPLMPFFLGLGYRPVGVVYWKVLSDGTEPPG